MEYERARDGVRSGGALGEVDERVGIAVLRERRTALGELLFDAPEQRDRGGPGGSIAGPALGAQVRAEREELSEVGHHTHVSLSGDADETVRVEIVAEQDAGIAVLGREQTRRAVVKEVALVDGLDAEGEGLLGERGEDRKLFALRLRAQCRAPERALTLRLERDRPPERRRL
jgi:hypothetical protein